MRSEHWLAAPAVTLAVIRLAEGLDFEAACYELGIVSTSNERQRSLTRLCEQGKIEREGGVIRVSRKAWVLADGIAAELF